MIFINYHIYIKVRISWSKKVGDPEVDLDRLLLSKLALWWEWRLSGFCRIGPGCTYRIVERWGFGASLPRCKVGRSGWMGSNLSLVSPGSSSCCWRWRSPESREFCRSLSGQLHQRAGLDWGFDKLFRWRQRHQKKCHWPLFPGLVHFVNQSNRQPEVFLTLWKCMRHSRLYPNMSWLEILDQIFLLSSIMNPFWGWER